jgi:hypothetical protein
MSNVQPFPVTASDLVDVVDLDPFASETTSELQNLAQDCYHWLLAWPGSNPDDLTRGVGVEQYLGGSTDTFASLPSAIETDFLKDTRILGCAAQIITNPDGSFLLNISVQAITGVLPLSFRYTQAGGLAPAGS